MEQFVANMFCSSCESIEYWRAYGDMIIKEIDWYCDVNNDGRYDSNEKRTNDRNAFPGNAANGGWAKMEVAHVTEESLNYYTGYHRVSTGLFSGYYEYDQPPYSTPIYKYNNHYFNRIDTKTEKDRS